MKNYLIIGLLILMSFSAGINYNQQMITPARPKSIVVETTDRHQVKDFTYRYFKAGYRIHIITAPNNSGNVIVVMEKY